MTHDLLMRTQNIMEYLMYGLKHAYSYGIDFLSMILLAIILIPIEISFVIGIQTTRYDYVSAFTRAVTTTFPTYNVELPENFEKHIMMGAIKSRCALGGLLYLLGYLSVSSAVCVGISGIGTGLWIYYLLKIITRETNQQHVPMPMPMPMPAPVQRILEPVIVATVDRGDVEPIDFTPWVNEELVWAINGDARHLIRDINADILANTENPINPLTRERIQHLTRARIVITENNENE